MTYNLVYNTFFFGGETQVSVVHYECNISEKLLEFSKKIGYVIYSLQIYEGIVYSTPILAE